MLTTVVTMFLLPGKETADADQTMAGIDTAGGTDQLTAIEIMDSIGAPRSAIGDLGSQNDLPGGGTDGDTSRVAQVEEAARNVPPRRSAFSCS